LAPDETSRMPGAEPSSVSSWYHRPLVVVASLLILFPVGLALALTAPWPRRWKRLLLIGGSAAVFAVSLHLLFGLRVTWGGGGPISPRVEFFRPGVHQRALAEQRREQARGGVALAAPAPVQALETQWPGFRGIARDGIVRSAVQLPWPTEGPVLLWEQPIGGGHASFAIVGGLAYTIEQRGQDEVVACYELDAGREVWTHRYRARFEEFFGGPGPRATPAVQDGRVFALGGTGVLTCLDAATGSVHWQRNILDDAAATNLPWAVSASPLVDEGRVYVVPGGSGASVVAYDVMSGEPVLKGGARKAGYASPMMATLAGSEQLLVFDGAGLSAYAPADVAELWHFPWQTSHDVNAGQPVVVDEHRVFISSGYGHGCALLQVDAVGGNFEVEQVWFNRNMRLKFSSAVLHDGYVYGLDNSILTCLEIETGARQWKGGRYGYGQLVLSDGYLIVQCEEGDIALVEATPQAHREVRRIEALNSRTWNHPAVADGKLLLRNDRQMMCYELGTVEAARSSN
jgi:outer membrane protein assembly factor BamB